MTPLRTRLILVISCCRRILRVNAYICIDRRQPDDTQAHYSLTVIPAVALKALPKSHIATAVRGQTYTICWLHYQFISTGYLYVMEAMADAGKIFEYRNCRGVTKTFPFRGMLPPVIRCGDCICHVPIPAADSRALPKTVDLADPLDRVLRQKDRLFRLLRGSGQRLLHRDI